MSISRDTPTAAGPKSFGKSRLGFCDRQRMVEKEIIKNIEDAGEDWKILSIRNLTFLPTDPAHFYFRSFISHNIQYHGALVWRRTWQRQTKPVPGIQAIWGIWQSPHTSGGFLHCIKTVLLALTQHSVSERQELVLCAISTCICSTGHHIVNHGIW